MLRIPYKWSSNQISFTFRTQMHTKIIRVAEYVKKYIKVLGSTSLYISESSYLPGEIFHFQNFENSTTTLVFFKH